MYGYGMNQYAAPYHQNGAMNDVLSQYKGQYQPQNFMAQPMSMQQPTPQNASGSEMIWVLSQIEAESFPVAANGSVILWDKNDEVIYIKSANAQGVPNMRILDYKERPQNAEKRPFKTSDSEGRDYVSSKEFDQLRAKFDELEAIVKESTNEKEKK